MGAKVMPPLVLFQTPPDAVPTTTWVQSLSSASIDEMRPIWLALPMFRQRRSLMSRSSSGWAASELAIHSARQSATANWLRIFML
jgi:hypothetical protein